MWGGEWLDFICDIVREDNKQKLFQCPDRKKKKPPLQVSVACRDILPGQEVTDCYGLPWYSVPKEKRNQIQTR